MMETFLAWNSQYTIPTVILISCLSIALYVGRLTIEQLIKKESDRQLKIFQARLDDVTANIQLLRERQASFADKVMSDRYTLIQEIENKLELVYINYDRWRRDPKLYRLERIDGETVLITEINSALRVNRAVLTKEFHDLLTRRFNLVKEFYDKNQFIEHNDEYLRLGELIQDKLEEVFRNPSKWIREFDAYVK